MHTMLKTLTGISPWYITVKAEKANDKTHISMVIRPLVKGKNVKACPQEMHKRRPYGRVNGQQNSSAAEFASTPLVNFWHTFRLFPSSFDESGFKYWYIYIYGLLALALIPLLAYYFHIIVPSSEYKLYTDNILLYILLPITLSLVVLSYNHSRRAIRGAFEDFETGRHLSSRRGESHFSEEYTSFLNAYQDKQLRSYRHIR